MVRRCYRVLWLEDLHVRCASQVPRDALRSAHRLASTIHSLAHRAHLAVWPRPPRAGDLPASGHSATFFKGATPLHDLRRRRFARSCGETKYRYSSKYGEEPARDWRAYWGVCSRIRQVVHMSPLERPSTRLLILSRHGPPPDSNLTSIPGSCASSRDAHTDRS